MDLERHRWRHRLNGFPIFGDWEDGEEDEIIGVIVEPDWQWSEMSEADQTTVRNLAASYLADPRGQGWTWDDAFPIALGEYGIACPHEWRYHEPVFKECKWCRVVEQLPGLRVKVGDRVMRVPDPPPRILRIPVPTTPNVYLNADNADMMSPTMHVDEYEWYGGSYHKVASR